MIAIFQGTNRWVGGQERPPWYWWWWVVEHMSFGHGRKKRVRGTEGEQRREKRKRWGERKCESEGRKKWE